MTDEIVKPTEADHNCGLLIAEAVNTKLAERKSPHWVEASADGVIVQAVARHSASASRDLIEALRKLRITAVLLLNQSQACAMNHYGDDFRGVLPGWLEDCRKDVLSATLELEKHGVFAPTPQREGGQHG